MSGTPLWTVHFNPRAFVLEPVDAQVDASGNTWVLANICHRPGQSPHANTFWAPRVEYSDCDQYNPFSSVVVRFDANGTFTGSFDVENTPAIWTVLRVTNGGVAAAQQWWSTKLLARVVRYDSSGQFLFDYVFPADGGMGGLDVCEDGTTVVAANQRDVGTTIYALDLGGNVRWQMTEPRVATTDLRCLPDGTIRIAGSRWQPPRLLPWPQAMAAQLESAGGAVDWLWVSPEPIDPATDHSLHGTLAAVAVDANGHTVVGTRHDLFGIDRRGTLLWHSSTPHDLYAMAVTDVVAAAGWELSPADSHTQVLNASGTLLWARDDDSLVDEPLAGTRIALDDAHDVFLCGNVWQGTTIRLYGADGSTQWTFDASASVLPEWVNVTAHVARCIGQAWGGGIGIVAFQVR